MKPTPIPLNYNLKKPCGDCPFLRSSELHKGVGSSLTDVAFHAENFELLHTCHKTDPRADSAEGQRFKGTAQHCAGLLAMQAQGGLAVQPGLFKARRNLRALKRVPGVFSFVDMVRTYAQWVTHGCPPGVRGSDLAPLRLPRGRA